MKSKICSKIDLLENEKIDEIGFGGLRLIQKPDEFCFGIDAVILADFASKSSFAAQKIIDLGTGGGVIPLILSHITEAGEILGLEVQQSLFERACRNVKLNGLEGRVGILRGDVADKAALKDRFGTFDLVISNPPYMKRSAGIKNKNGPKMIARHETTASLRDFIEAASLLLREKGSFCVVHRPERLVDLCSFCREYRLEPKTLQFVSPNRDKASNILLMHCVKYGGHGLKLPDPLYVYDETGSYTEEINRIYERI